MIGNNQSMMAVLGWWRAWRHQSTYVPSLWLMTESEAKYVDWWRQTHHRPSTALIDWLLPIKRKVYSFAIGIHLVVFPFIWLYNLYHRNNNIITCNRLKTKSHQHRAGGGGGTHILRHNVLQFWVSFLKEIPKHEFHFSWKNPIANPENFEKNR